MISSLVVNSLTMLNEDRKPKEKMVVRVEMGVGGGMDKGMIPKR